MAVKTLRPAVVSGPMQGSNLRVVWDENTVVVVSQQAVRYLRRTDDAVTSTSSGRNVIPTTEGDLVAIQQGGCNCGKPWLTKPPAATLLADAPV